MFGPSGIPPLLWPRLTSPRPSQRLSTSVALGSRVDLPGYCAPTFTLMPVGYTPHRSVQVSGFGHFRCLTPMRRLVSASCSSGQRFASGFLRIRSRPQHPCLWLTLPLVGRVEDFHPQVGAPCRAHENNNAALGRHCRFCTRAVNPASASHYGIRASTGSPRPSLQGASSSSRYGVHAPYAA